MVSTVLHSMNPSQYRAGKLFSKKRRQLRPDFYFLQVNSITPPKRTETTVDIPRLDGHYQVVLIAPVCLGSRWFCTPTPVHSKPTQIIAL